MKKELALQELKILLETKKQCSLFQREIGYQEENRITVLRKFLDSLNDDENTIEQKKTTTTELPF